MKRFGIKLEDRMYHKNEVESLLHRVVSGMLNEELIRLQCAIDNQPIYILEDFVNKELNLLERSTEENDIHNVVTQYVLVLMDV